MPPEDPLAVLQIDQEGPVRVLRLNRPDALNSLDETLQGVLLDALEAAAGDAGVRAVVLTGAGRAFCSGQDLNDPAVNAPADQSPADLGAVIERRYRPLVLRLRSMPVPTVAAVNGVAAGAGASLALACDLVLAARSASFIQAFSRLGLVPDTGATWLLPRLVGSARALGLALLGERLTAADAAQWGLIWRMVEDADLLPEAMAVAGRLAALPLRGLVATRMAFEQASHSSLADALTQEAQWQRQLGQEDDYREGVAAFRARRPPRFTGR